MRLVHLGLVPLVPYMGGCMLADARPIPEQYHEARWWYKDKEGWMTQYAWVLEVRPGYEEEYVRRHQEIWPEMVGALKEAGIRNYSIFRYGLTLFGYFETDDIEKTQECLANSETNQRWSEWMDPIMKVDLDPTTQFPHLLPLQWHMD
jgi:L-rhamnose mutarotase